MTGFMVGRGKFRLTWVNIARIDKTRLSEPSRELISGLVELSSFMEGNRGELTVQRREAGRALVAELAE